MIYREKGPIKHLNLIFLVTVVLMLIIVLWVGYAPDGFIIFCMIANLMISITYIAYRYYYLEISDDGQRVFYSYLLPFIRYKYDLADIKVVWVVDYAYNIGYNVSVVIANKPVRKFRTVRIPITVINSFMDDLKAKGIEVDYRYIKSASF